MRFLCLALSAQQKNLVDNPLKAAWFETLNGMEIENPQNIIEATFSRAAAEHFEVTLAKTAEYLTLGDEAFVEVESQIGDLDTLPPVTASMPMTARHERAASLRNRAIENSLPLSTASSSNTNDDAVERMASVLPKPKLFGISRLPK